MEDVLPSLGFKLHQAPGTKMVEFVYEFAMPGGGTAQALRAGVQGNKLRRLKAASH